MFQRQRTKRQILFHEFLDEMNTHSFYPPPFLGNENSKKLGSGGTSFSKNHQGKPKGDETENTKVVGVLWCFFILIYSLKAIMVIETACRNSFSESSGLRYF